METTNAEKQAMYRQRLIDKGIVLVQVRVPFDKVEKLKNYAKKLREGE